MRRMRSGVGRSRSTVKPDGTSDNSELRSRTGHGKENVFCRYGHPSRIIHRAAPKVRKNLFSYSGLGLGLCFGFQIKNATVVLGSGDPQPVTTEPRRIDRGPAHRDRSAMPYPECGDEGAVQKTLLDPPVGAIRPERWCEMNPGLRRHEPERGEILRQPLAGRLDKRLLQCPQPEKAPQPFRFGQAGKPGNLLWREITISHFEADGASKIFEIEAK